MNLQDGMERKAKSLDQQTRDISHSAKHSRDLDRIAFLMAVSQITSLIAFLGFIALLQFMYLK